MIVDIQTILPVNTEQYGKCLLVKTFPVIESPFGWGGCVDMYRTIKLLYPDTPKMVDFLRKAKNNNEEYFEFAENDAFSMEYVLSIRECYVHNSFNEKNLHPLIQENQLILDFLFFGQTLMSVLPIHLTMEFYSDMEILLEKNGQKTKTTILNLILLALSTILQQVIGGVVGEYHLYKS